MTLAQKVEVLERDMKELKQVARLKDKTLSQIDKLELMMTRLLAQKI
ncbi:hypothetical protein [Endozoicomonas numazuensis]|nr:hypothetical protein [Endozoicomonas numazuensis]